MPTEPSENHISAEAKRRFAAVVAVILIALGGYFWVNAVGAKNSPIAGQTPTPTASPSPLPDYRLVYARNEASALGKTKSELFSSTTRGEEVKSLGVLTARNAYFEAEVAPTGHLAFLTSTGTENNPLYSLEMIEPDGERSKVLTLKAKEYIADLAISQDGTKIAYVKYTTASQSHQIWSINNDGSDNKMILKDLTYPDSSIWYLAPAQWSADLRYLYLRPGTAGTDAPRPLTFHRLEVTTGLVDEIASTGTAGWRPGDYAYSPDSSKIAYYEFETAPPTPEEMWGATTASALRIYDLKSKKISTLTNTLGIGSNYLRWSQDGKTLAASNNTDICTIAADKGDVHCYAANLAADTRISDLEWAGERLVYTTAGNIDGMKQELHSILATGTDHKLITSGSSTRLIGAVNSDR